MIPKNRVVAPWLRSSMMYEQGLEQSGYYRKRTQRNSFLLYFWLSVIIAAVLALVMTSHYDEEMTAAVNRKAVMAWTGDSDAGFWLSRELFILRECKNADRVYQQIQQAAR